MKDGDPDEGKLPPISPRNLKRLKARDSLALAAAFITAVFSSAEPLRTLGSRVMLKILADKGY